MTRTRLYTTVLITMLFPLQLSAQRGAELTAFGGYQVGGKLEVQEGDLRISDNPNFGVILNVPVQSGGQAELLWAHQETNLQLTDRTTGVQTELFPMSVDYFQLGGLLEADRSGRMRAYGMGTLGATLFSPQGTDRSSEWRFSGGFGVGAKSFLNERVGIRTEARLMFTLINGAGSIWCGGGGCLTNVSGTAIAQLLLTAGLTFKMGR
jgi:hypothetical protein